MKKVLLLLLVSASISGALSAQSNYKSAIGGRLGTTPYDILSFSYKNFSTSQGALEFNAGFGSKGYNHGNDHDNTFALSGAISYQHHFKIKPVDGLQWFIGGGLALYNTFSDYNDYQGFGFGIFPTGGIDYKFAGVPLNLTLDGRPTIMVTGPNNHESLYHNVGLAARYTIGGK